ncbi:hypothetical protein N9J50_01830 [Methylophilaceae bacterium]|nr:hypothetical protein [Methylophilaceae bacterium]
MDKEEQLALAREKAREASLGNNFSSKKNRLLKDTLNRIITQDDALRARRVMEALVQKAEEGDTKAIDMVLDRLEGKVQSQTDITSSDGSLSNNLKIEFVDVESKVSE